MANQENDDELQAKKWLASQGYTDICRPSDDPPDYVVDGKYAIEVRRVNLTTKAEGQIKGIEESQKPLRKLIKDELESLGPPDKGKSWYVDCEYNYLSNHVTLIQPSDCVLNILTPESTLAN